MKRNNGYFLDITITKYQNIEEANIEMMVRYAAFWTMGHQERRRGVKHSKVPREGMCQNTPCDKYIASQNWPLRSRDLNHYRTPLVVNSFPPNFHSFARLKERKTTILDIFHTLIQKDDLYCHALLYGMPETPWAQGGPRDLWRRWWEGPYPTVKKPFVSLSRVGAK